MAKKQGQVRKTISLEKMKKMQEVLKLILLER